MTPYDTLVETLGHRFADATLMAAAMTHTSYAHENGGPDYERLEFLGDAVLQLCATALLMERFPDAREGALSRLRSRLVSTRALAELARGLAVGPALRLGIGEEATGGRDRPRVLAGAMEAIIGALYTDAGFDRVFERVSGWLDGPLCVLEAEAQGGWKDARSLLQEQLQREVGQTPTYGVTSQGGPPHDPTFVVEVRLGERVLGRGEGSSKREASRRAAEDALSGEVV